MRVVDFLLRLIFFAVVPFCIVLATKFVPMGGVLANVALMLLVFVFAEVVRAWTQRWRILGLVTKGFLSFDEYYRTHPPKPFVYYVFFPLLFPYWLIEKRARREFFIYRNFGAGSLAVLAILSALDFYLNWQPEIPFRDFAVAWIAVFISQSILLLVFLLPIVTTVVTCHLEKRNGALIALFCVAVLSVAGAVGILALRKEPVVSFVTQDRVRLRTKAVPAKASDAQLAALRSAWAYLPELKASTAEDGWVEGDMRDRIEEILGAFYRTDEAQAFTIHALPAKDPEIVVIQCNLGKRHPPLWRAIKKTGKEVKDPAELPPGILGSKARPHKRPPKKTTAPAKSAAPAATKPQYH